MRALMRSLFLLLVPVAAFGQVQTIVTGTVGGATSGYVEFRLMPRGSSVLYFVSGTQVIAPQTFRCSINASGAIVATSGGPCLVWANTVISPGNTTYTVDIAPGNTVSNTVPNLCISGTTWSLSSPTFCPVINLVPQFFSLTTPPFNANITSSANKVFNIGDANTYYAAAYIDTLFTNNLGMFPATITVGTGTISNTLTVNGTLLGSGTVIVPASLSTPGFWYGTSGLKNVTFLGADPTSGILQMQPVGNGMTSALHAQVTSGTLPSGTLAEFVVTRTPSQAFGGSYSRFSMTSINSPSSFDAIHIEAGGTETSPSGNTLMKYPFLFSIGIENPAGTFTSYEAMRLLSDADTGNVGFAVSTVGTTVRNAVQIYGPQLSSQGTSDGHSLEFFAYSFDTMQHAVNWRMNVHPTTNAGVSTFQLQNRVDNAAFGTKLAMDDGSNLSLNGNPTTIGANITTLGIIGGAGDNTRSGGSLFLSNNGTLQGACYFVNSIFQCGTITNQAFNFITNNTVKWQIDTSGNYLPNVDNTQNVGSSSKRAASVFTPIVDSGTGSLTFRSNSTTAWSMDTSQFFLPNTDNNLNIGSSSKRVAAIALGTSLVLGGANPALTGFIRMPNNSSSAVTARNAANGQDVVMVGVVDGSNNVLIGDGVNGAQLQLRAVGQVKVLGNNVSLGTTVGTVAQLPGSPTEGDCKAVSDSMTATYNATVTGSGTNHIIACWNGTNWVAH